MRVVLTRREGLDAPDGVSIFIVSLAQAMIELGHQVKIVVGVLRSHHEYQRLLAPRLDIPILALSSTPLTGLASVRAWLRAKQAIDNFEPDLVIHSEAVPVPLRGRSVQVVHDLEPRIGRLAPVWRGIRRFSTRHCDHIVATTTELLDELVGDLGVPPSRLTLIPKCIDRQVYSCPHLSARERAILHAGTLPYKDPRATIRAFGALGDASVGLYIAGDITAAAREEVDALPPPLRSCVTFMGPTEGQVVRSLHSRVRVAAFPTRYAIPVASATVMEAIASGTPIVGSFRLSRDVLVDGENGLVVNAEPDTIAAALRAVLNDDDLWLRLSAGAGRMIKRFDFMVWLVTTLDFCQQESRNRYFAPVGFQAGSGLHLIFLAKHHDASSGRNRAKLARFIVGWRGSEWRGVLWRASMIVAYCRISMMESGLKLEAQERALAAIGAQEFFSEKTSLFGHTPELERAIVFAQKGDVIVVTRPYRIARSTGGVLALINRLRAKGVGFRILDTPIDTSTTTGRMILGSAPVWSLGMSPLRSALWDLSFGGVRLR